MILYLLFKLAFLSAFMIYLTQLKYKNKKSYIILSVFIFIIWIINSVIYKFTNMNFLNSIYPLTVFVPAFICFFLLSKSKGLKVLFTFLTVCNFGMLMSFVGLLSFIIFSNLTIRILFESLCFVLIVVLILKVFQKPYFKILNTFDKGWGFLCLAPSLLTLIIYLLLYYPTEFNNRLEIIPIIFLVFALMFVFYVTVYLNFENASQFYQSQQDKKFLLIQMNMQKKEYNALMEKIDGIQIYRHDMRHQINTINIFLNDANISEAQKYLSKLNDNFSKTIVEKYCENYGVNVILSSYINKAKEEQINVICKAQISENIKIDNIELGLIFANAIENATIACKKIKTPEDRKVAIICKEHYNQLYIQISNTYVGDVLFDKDLPISNHKDHGFGTQSIVAIVEKYDGVYSFTAEKGIFKATAILKYE